MENEVVLLNGGASKRGFISYGNGIENCGNGLENASSYGNEAGNGSLADEVLEGLEEYWEDINDRLMISRMVSDSVIKGMVTAVEQEAAEKIRSLELEMLSFKQRLSLGVSDFKPDRLIMEQRECAVGNFEGFLSYSDAGLVHEKMKNDLHDIRNEVREQIKNVKNEIDCVRGFSCIEKSSSNSKIVGLSGIRAQKQSGNELNLIMMLDNLKSSVDTLCTKTDSVLLSSKTSLSELQHELELLKNIEGIVIQSVLKSVQEEFEGKCAEEEFEGKCAEEEFEGNWAEQNALYCRVNRVNLLEKFNDVSSIRSQLDSILKSLSISETGLISHGSLDLENSPHKATFHTLVPFSEEHGTLEASDIHVAESYNFQQLKHMSKEELVNHFNNIITNLKRDHESALHKKTEKYFILRREYLKERRAVAARWKDEEFDVLRKKIREVVLKLEDFLSEGEKIHAVVCDDKRVEDLLSENLKLRTCLADKNNEANCLELAVDDSLIEASLIEEVYKCALRDLIELKRSENENSEMEFKLMRETYDIIVNEAYESKSKYEIEDLEIESSMIQELSSLILREAIKETEEKMNNLHQEVLVEKRNRISLESKVSGKENEFKLVADEKERLKQEVLSMVKALEQKEKLSVDLSVSLSKEKEQFELASRELSSLRENLSRQQSIVAATNEKCESLSAKFLEAVEQIKVGEFEVHKLDEELDRTKKMLKEADKERNMVCALAQERLDKLLLSETREKNLKKEVHLLNDNIHGLAKIFDDFECRMGRAISKNNIRLEDATSQLTDLAKMTCVLRKKTELVYKQKLERKCADLRTAEAEVDHLGDEVDALLRIMEKMYIALDHYSPILKHYPGIMEILKLVRRELSGESTKLSQSTQWKG